MSAKEKDKNTTTEIIKTAEGGQLEADVPVAAAPAVLEPSRHHVTAATILTGMRGYAALIEGFGRAAAGRRVEIANYSSMPDEAFEVVARGLDTSPLLVTSAKLTSAEVRDAIAYTDAYTELRDELQVFVQALDDSIAEKRGVVGERCSRAVKIGDQLTLKSENQGAVLHLRTMVKVFRSRRRKSQPVERDVIKTVKDIRRRVADSATVELIGGQTPIEPVTATFKAGRDLES